MSAHAPSSASVPSAVISTQRLRVWDLPTRLFHWALVGGVSALVVTAKLGAMEWHFRLGYAVLALLLFRLLWGFCGGHWSRFASFVYGPRALGAYLRGQARPEHRIGHNPLGALSVWALLAVLLAQVSTGLVSDDAISFSGPLAQFVPGAWSEAGGSWHKGWGQWLLLALALLHLLAIGFYAFIKRDRLIAPMIGGDKLIHGALDVPASRDNSASRWLALMLFGLCTGLAWWLASMQG